jgi:mercuric ion transport protein
MQSANASTKNPAAAPRKRLGLGLMALAVTSSIIASTCCVLPLVLVLVGITGAWMVNLAALKPVTPIFAALALGTLAWAGYLLFQPAPTCSMEDRACDTTRPVMRRVFVGCAVFIGLLLLFPLIAPVFY